MKKYINKYKKNLSWPILTMTANTCVLFDWHATNHLYCHWTSTQNQAFLNINTELHLNHVPENYDLSLENYDLSLQNYDLSLENWDISLRLRSALKIDISFENYDINHENCDFCNFCWLYICQTFPPSLIYIHLPLLPIQLYPSHTISTIQTPYVLL